LTLKKSFFVPVSQSMTHKIDLTVVVFHLNILPRQTWFYQIRLGFTKSK